MTLSLPRAHGPAAEVFQPGTHGTTFGGNPLAMRAGVVTIEAMEAEGLLANAAAVGGFIIDSLKTTVAGHPSVVDIRGQGLMIGIELDRPCGDLVGQALAAGVVLNVACIAVALSGIISLSLTPMLCSRYLTTSHSNLFFFRWFEAAFEAPFEAALEPPESPPAPPASAESAATRRDRCSG